MTQEEHLTTFLALPSRSILHRPAHSPSFMLLSTLSGRPPRLWTRGRRCSVSSPRIVTNQCTRSSS